MRVSGVFRRMHVAAFVMRRGRVGKRFAMSGARCAGELRRPVWPFVDASRFLSFGVRLVGVSHNARSSLAASAAPVACTTIVRVVCLPDACPILC